MNYTHDKNQIVFLKDADIVSAFNEKNALDEVVLSNGIPSYELFKKTYDELSTYDNNICAYIKDNVNVSVDNISVLLYGTLLSTNGISCKINSLCTELSNAHNFLSSALSSEIEKLSTSLSTTTKLSIDLLQRCIVSNDNDISVISTYLSNDAMHYKGDLVFAAGDQLLKTVFGRTVKADKYKFLDGFVYRAPSDCVVLESSEPGARQIEFEENDYLIFKQDVELSELTFNSFVLIKDYDKEIKRTYDKISTEIHSISDEILLSVSGLSNYVDNLELSVNGLSVKVNKISSELSTELKNCELSVSGLSNYVDNLELSVNGLSVKVNKISSELSTEVNKCELSVSSLSSYVDSLELSVNGLSVRTNKICSDLSIAHNFLSSALSSEILKLSTSLSNTTNLSIELLCSEIIANDKDISTLSTDISVLEYHYDRTFDEKHYTRGTTVKDISVDVLNIVDSEETDNQYTLQFLSGTLVLVKKTI